MRLMPSATQPCGIKELVASLRPGSLAANGAKSYVDSLFVLQLKTWGRSLFYGIVDADVDQPVRALVPGESAESWDTT